MKFLLILLFSFSVLAADSKCSQVKMKRTQTSPVSEISVNICFKESSSTFYSADADVEKIRAIDPSAFKTLPSLGNPSFQICRQIGGIPEIVKIKRGEWVDADRCILSDGKSFVSGDYLMELLYPNS